MSNACRDPAQAQATETLASGGSSAQTSDCKAILSGIPIRLLP
jgi:hypothetical protein